MDKQRLQAYYQLIQQLLSCADGEESAILQANTELLDADFLQLLKEGVAQMSTQEGQENRANKLMFLESQLSEYLNISLEENTPETETPVNEADIETYLPFLQQVLKTTAESRGNPQEVYPLLAANTDKLNLTFAKVLQVWATTTIAEAKPDTAKDIFRFSNRIQEFPLGNKANNLEIAITGYEICSTVFTRNSSPESWAAVKNNLGNTYSDRIRGDKAENLENAIAAYKEALEVRTRNDFPVQWATTQNNLATAYSDRIRGDKAENLENAIAAYKEALEVYTRNDFPVDWAITQNNLATAYSNRIRGDKAENLENAIAAYKEALEVRTRNDFPVQWAMTQNNLATAYWDRIRGDKAENLEYAIAAYKEALKVRTRSDFPLNNAETLLNLGIAYQDSQQLNLAYDTFTEAIITVENIRGEIISENIRGEIISGEESKRKQAEEWNKLYRRMVEVCLGLGRETEAITYIERSKTRNLVELISGDIAFTPIQYAEIQNLLDDKTAIIQFYIFNDCFRAFIITHNNEKPIILQSTEENLTQLVDVIKEYLILYSEDRNKWRNQLNNQLTKLAEILQINQIIAQVPTHIQKIIIIPHRYLHLLPFHAIPLSAGEYLIDKYPAGVSYAPSCQILKLTQKPLSNSLLQGERTRLNNLFAIQNPTNNLKFTDIEVETIANNFNPHKILKHEEASKDAFKKHLPLLTNSQWLHFSCHGHFDLTSPLKSALQLAKSEVRYELTETSSSRYVRVDAETDIDSEERLTLKEILELKLSQCYLVCLSACETGVIDFSSNSDEYIGLSSGFIQAGAVNVVSSLWSVRDFHTSLLMIKLYENITQNPHDITLALNNAQQWLRQATQTQIIDWLNNKTDMHQEQKQQIIDVLSQQYKPEHKPFNKPEFWAGFCAFSPVKSPL
ncbi:CHAT domain-containing protein [Sphaerospermopsis sp. LEGE 08334]|uniref:CHAT domain-containing protein n=1 Tax=Sphaerospermopsis sp. LEGE 08334 TaxID=1828651 RepID=UPI00187F49C3|nr:CHAT domain-containing protein [Sphaerospermopsis sp. LEGE 08334]MBE9054614.1 CHAT domain-containing protein [Sphaerospermopsis sp. LEGE 08334]